MGVFAFRPIYGNRSYRGIFDHIFSDTGYPKSPILRGGKPALLFPFGWQIAVQMGWSRGKQEKGLF